MEVPARVFLDPIDGVFFVHDQVIIGINVTAEMVGAHNLGITGRRKYPLPARAVVAAT
jgi:hypothetical protein